MNNVLVSLVGHGVSNIFNLLWDFGTKLNYLRRQVSTSVDGGSAEHLGGLRACCPDGKFTKLLSPFQKARIAIEKAPWSFEADPKRKLHGLEARHI